MLTKVIDALYGDLKAALGSTSRVYRPMPVKPVPTCAVIRYEPNAITAGQTFGSYRISIAVELYARRASEADPNDVLSDMIDAVIRETADWGLSGVDSFDGYVLGDVECIGAVVHLSKNNQRL